MKTLLLLALLAPFLGEAQSCSVPQPLTKDQEASVRGTWTGYYELTGERTQFSLTIGSNGLPFTLITEPPLKGAELKESYRFCGAGAFHFRKTVSTGYYEFDGVPEGSMLRGTLVVEVKGVKTTGKFELVREDGG